MAPYYTNNLILRHFTQEDFTSFQELNADVDVMKYFLNTLTPEEAKIAFKKILDFWEKHKFGVFAVEEKKSGKWIGFVGFNIPSFMPNSIEILWRLKKEFWGEGYATEAAKKCLEIGFAEYNFKEIIAFTTEINTKSIAVMKKAGLMPDVSRNFHYPNIEKTHQLSFHVFYSIQSV